MKVVLPFFTGDQWLAEKNLRWMRKLDERLDYNCILACDDTVRTETTLELAQVLFRSVHVFKYPKHRFIHWPFPQNNAFMHTAWEMAKQKEPWAWVETDSVPIKKGWLTALEQEYLRGKKPFGGHWNPATEVFNGVAIYPPNISFYAPKIMTAALMDGRNEHGQPYQPPWDAYGSTDVKPHLHVMNRIMQHLWSINDVCPTFPTKKAVTQLLRDEVVLFHRCKDGSLIDRLEEGPIKCDFGTYCLVKEDTVHARNKRFALT